MINVNLVPAEALQEEAKNDLLFAGAFFAAIVLLGIAGFYVSSMMAEKKVDKRLATAKEHLKTYQDTNAKVEGLRKSKAMLTKRKGVIENLIKNRLLYSVFMHDFVSILPDKVWVQNIRTKSSGSGGLDLDITAKSFSAFFIADWITAIEEYPGMTFKGLGAVSTQKREKQNLYNFTIKCSYRKQ